jgi:hypothetical protein
MPNTGHIGLTLSRLIGQIMGLGAFTLNRAKESAA